MDNHESFRPSSRAALAAGLVLCGLLARPASAATLTWGTSGTGGSGTWSTSGTGWWNGTTTGTWNNSNNDIASFGGTAGTVTLSESISAGGLTFATTGYTLTGGTLTLANTPTITVNPGLTATVASVVSGSTLAKSGSGTLILSGSVALSGSTTINAGTLQFSGTGTVGDIGLAAGGVNASLTFATGANMTTGAINKPGYGGSITIQSGATVTSASYTQTQSDPPLIVDGTWTVTGVMTGSGGTENWNGVGTINTYQLDARNSVKLNLAVARLNIGGGGITNFGSGYAVNFNGSTIGAYADWNSNLPFGLTQTTTFNTLDSVDGTTPRTITLAGYMTGAGGLTKSGLGTLKLTGGNSYNGATTVSSGVLQVGDGGTLGSIADASPISISSGATLVFNRTGALTYGGTVSGAGALTKLGSGTVTLSGPNTYTGTTTISAGILQIGGGGTTGSIADASPVSVASGATLAFNRSDALTYGGTVSGAGGLTKLGSGTVTLAGANTYTGVTTVSNGVLTLSGSLASGGVTLNGAANTPRLNVGSATALGTGTFTITGGPNGSFDNSSGGPLTLTTNNVQTWSNDFTFAGSNALNLGTGAVTMTGSRFVTVSSNTLTVGGAISGSTATVGLIKQGPGTLVLTNTASGYQGNTNIWEGTLRVSSIANYGTSSSIGNATAGGDIKLGSASTTGTLDYVGGVGSSNRSIRIGANDNTTTGGGVISVNGGDLTFTSSTFNLASGSAAQTRTLTLGGTGNGTIQGVIQNNSASGAVKLVKADTGVWTLSSTASSFTGGVDVGSGTLAFSSGALGATGSITFTGNSTLAWSAGNAQDVSARLAMTNGVTSTLDTGTNTVTLATGFGGSTSGALTKLGAGTLVLSGSNSYAGTTTVSSGTLLLANGLALQNSTLSGSAGTVLFQAITSATFGGLAGSRNLALSNTASAAVALAVGNNNETTTYSGTLSGLGSLTKLGSGTLALAAANTYGGATTVGAGVVRFDTLAAGSGAQALGSGSVVNLGVAATSTGELNYFAATSGTLDKNVFALGSGRNRIRNSGGGTLTLAGTLTKDGTILELAGGTFAVTGQITGASQNSDFYVNGASVTLSNTNNNYNGPTYVYGGGTLTLGTSSVIPNGSALILGGTGGDTGTGTLDLGSFSDTVAGVTLTSGSIIGSGTLAAPNYTLAGGVVTANLGTGTVTVTANSSLNGTVAATVLNLNAGALTLGGGGGRFTGSPAVSGSSGASLTLGGNESFGSLAGAANIALGNFTLSVGSAGTSGTYSGLLSGAGGLTKTGTGTLALAAANTFTGPTTVQAGTLAFSIPNALAAGSWLTLGGTGSVGTLDMGAHSVSLARLDFVGGGGYVQNAAGTLTLSGTSGPALVNVTGGSASLGGNVNVLHPPVTLGSAVEIAVSSGASFILHSTLTGTYGLTKSGVGTMDVYNDSNSFSGPVSITGGRVNLVSGSTPLGTGTITLSGGSTLDVNALSLGNRLVVTSGTVLNQTAASVTTIDGASTVQGSPILGSYNVNAGGNAQFADPYAGASVTVQAGGQATFSGSVSSVSIVTVNSTGTASLSSTLSGNVTSSGMTTLSGVLAANSTVTVGGGITAISGSAADNSNVVVNGGLASFTGPNAATVTVGASGAATVSGAVLTGAHFVNAGSLTLTNVSQFAADDIENTGSFVVNATSNDLVIASSVSGSGSLGSLTKSGASTLTLTGANVYAAGVAVTGGKLQVGDGGTAGSLASSLISVSSGAVLAFNRNDNYGGSFASLVSGSGNVRVDAGYLNMLGLNTYTGTTSVLPGATLAVNGSLANTALLVDAGATLKGSGTIAGLTTIAGLHAPGNSPGIETFGNLSYASGASVQWELWGNTATNSPLAFDQIVVNGDLAFSGSTALNVVFTGSAGPSNYSTVAWANEFWGTSHEWLVYDVAGTTTGFGNLALNTTDWLDSTTASFQSVRGGSTFSVEQRGNDVYVVYFAAVPEPGTLALAGIGIGVAAWSLRRRRRSTGTGARQR